MLSTILSLLLSLAVNAQMSPDWSREATVTPGETRANIYQVEESQLNQLRDNGYIHAMKYPVEVTGLLIPYRPFLNVLNADTRNPIRQVILAITKGYAGFKTEDEFYQWLGLSKFNSPNAVGIYKMPRPADQPNSLYVGAGIIKNASGEGLTFSCFACHSTNLFGTTVMGLTNKKPHSNKLFHMARRVIPNVPNAMFVLGGKASRGELDMFIRTKANILSVDSVLPQVYGLDTSLPHTALSLARRNNDEFASKNPNLEKYPRENELSTFVADSKPMPWWNLKYKTRWLSDGSVVSGNPIFTNILWNEIGRGTDLRELEAWMKNNSKKVEELTAAAFATEAPRYTDFFPMGSINIESAKRGQALYNQSCLKCHGDYQKGWQAPNAAELSDNDLIKTTKVIYHEKTPVRDVGTDPQRYEAMKYFADDLNNLAISKWMKTVVEPQKGYVPPPLIGVWSRWPYFHNNSVPTLCGVLSLEKDRPKTFYLGGADNINTDFDQECNGYPTGAKTPVAWTKDADSKFDTTKPGLRNSGHTSMLVDANGNEKFSAQDKKDIVMFLKTL